MAISVFKNVDGTETPIQVDIPVATTSEAGKVKPDGTSITIDPDGTIHSAGGGGNASIDCGYFSVSGTTGTFHPMAEQVQATPVLSGADSSKVTSSSDYNAGYAAWHALDGDVATYWVSEYALTYPAENWIKIVLDRQILPTMFYWVGSTDNDVDSPTKITVKDFDTDEILFQFVPESEGEERFVWRNPGATATTAIKVIYDQPSRCSGAREIKLFGLPVSE